MLERDFIRGEFYSYSHEDSLNEEYLQIGYYFCFRFLLHICEITRI